MALLIPGPYRAPRTGGHRGSGVWSLGLRLWRLRRYPTKSGFLAPGWLEAFGLLFTISAGFWLILGLGWLWLSVSVGLWLLAFIQQEFRVSPTWFLVGRRTS